MTTTIKLNKKEQRKANIEKHYQLCEQLGKITGSKLSGKKISIELFKLEKLAHDGATARCNGENARAYFPGRIPEDFDFNRDENAWETFCERVEDQMRNILGSIPTGFFVNGDPRGYALKLEENSIDLPMHTDWGRYQILSPTIE